MQRTLLARLALFFYLPTATGQEQDIIATIESQLPDDWSCELQSNDGNACVIVNANEIETIGSIYGNSAPGTVSQSVSI